MNERRIINILEGKNMQDHSVEKESQEPYNGASAQQQVPGPDLTPETLYQPVPEQAQTPPPTTPVQPRRSGGGLRAGAILIMALVLLLVLGWVYLPVGSSAEVAPPGQVLQPSLAHLQHLFKRRVNRLRQRLSKALYKLISPHRRGVDLVLGRSSTIVATL